jgi:hypothetical protein
MSHKTKAYKSLTLSPEYILQYNTWQHETGTNIVSRHYPSSCFYLKTWRRRQNPVSETFLKLKQDGVLDKNRAMHDVQKHTICINVTLSQTFRYYKTGSNTNFNAATFCLCSYLTMEHFPDERRNVIIEW